MTLGKKIKNARLALGLTQAAVGGDLVTRNMISSIESDKATPSFDTLKHIASVLNLPLGYLLGDVDTLFFYKKAELIDQIRSLLKNCKYSECIELCLSLGESDDEIEYILALCHYEKGVQFYKGGSFVSAKKSFSESLSASERTIYQTDRIRLTIPLYLSVCNNYNSPLLEFDSEGFRKDFDRYFENELYHYLTLDVKHEFRHPPYGMHIEAKRLIKERKYKEALDILLLIEQTRSNYDYDAYLMFSVYADIDTCYKQLFDFENAYRYASKRISLIEGFNF